MPQTARFIKAKPAFNSTHKPGGSTMFHSTKTLSMLSTLLLISCATAPSGKSFDSPIGVWSEQYESSTGIGGIRKRSKVTIIDETKGTYTNPSGRIEFYAIDGQRRWKGYWINQSGTYNLCSEEKGGSPYWGENIYQFNEAYNRYTGTWDFCGEGQKYALSGVR
jgi:hypothetical protein